MKLHFPSLIAAYALALLADAGIAAEPGPLMGKRFFTLNTVVRVNQIEVTRDQTHGVDESSVHTLAEAKLFRETIEQAWPGAHITWAFSWQALKDPRDNYREIRDYAADCHRKLGDEVTFLPGGYFANMYNSREQVNRDLHDGLQLVSNMVGNGYRPRCVIAGFLSSANLKYLADKENIHVCQGNIFSQYAVDNGDGEGSICYPYYPSTEHFCKPAQGPADFIDCVNLDGWTVDFLCARIPGAKMVDGVKHRSRQGVGPIETVIWLGTEEGTKSMLHTTATHFDDGFQRNGFGWVNCGWELSLVEARKLFKSYEGRNGMEGLKIWLEQTRKRWPDAEFVTLGEFGMRWRAHHKNNDAINYQFVQRGCGVRGSIENLEIRWWMNKDFRLATLRDWKQDAPASIIDFTRYDLTAQEPGDPTPGQHSRNWSLMNRLNQKGTRPQDQPIQPDQLSEEERQFIGRRCGLLK
ncbi:MAG TPA: DUF3863 domain-containing protein [Luteolibacter sp.]|nr:DUF3863 domain-containing protein [Luteolibacter sp.]